MVELRLHPETDATAVTASIVDGHYVPTCTDLPLPQSGLRRQLQWVGSGRWRLARKQTFDGCTRNGPSNRGQQDRDTADRAGARRESFARLR